MVGLHLPVRPRKSAPSPVAAPIRAMTVREWWLPDCGVDRRRRLSHLTAEGLEAYVGQALSPANRFVRSFSPSRLRNSPVFGASAAAHSRIASPALVWKRVHTLKAAPSRAALTDEMDFKLGTLISREIPSSAGKQWLRTESVPTVPVPGKRAGAGVGDWWQMRAGE